MTRIHAHTAIAAQPGHTLPAHSSCEALVPPVVLEAQDTVHHRWCVFSIHMHFSVHLERHDCASSIGYGSSCISNKLLCLAGPWRATQTLPC